MTPPQQAMAARLTAIAERLKKNSIGARAGYLRSEEGHDLDVTAMYADLDFLLAHVETLTQQVAGLTARQPWTICDFCGKPVVGLTGKHGAHDRCGDGPKA